MATRVPVRLTTLLALFATVAVLLLSALPAMASGPLIVGNNANIGGGPIQTYDFSTGGSPLAEFVPSGAGGSNNGRGLEVIGSEVFYTELSNSFGASDAIHVAPYNGGAGGADTRTIPNPRPTTGIQDLAASGGSLYALTGYPYEELQVFKLRPSSGAVLAGPIKIAAPAAPDSDGFTVLPNGNFLINSGDASCEYNQYNGSTGALVNGTTINVPGGGSCTGVDNDGTSLFFQTGFSGFTQTDMSGNLTATQSVSGENQGIEDISLVQSASRTPKPKKKTYKYCAAMTPQSIDAGHSEVAFKPCMKATDTYNGVSVSTVSITQPPNSTKSGGCPSIHSHGFSKLECEVTKVGSHASGSSVTDYVNMNLTWSSSTPLGGYGVVTEIEKDTATLSVTTTADGHQTGSNVVTFVSQQVIGP